MADLLGQLRGDWRRTGRTLNSRLSARAFAERHHDLGLAVEDMFDVTVLLETRSPKTPIEKAMIVRAMLEDADDPEIHRALVQSLIPGAVSACRQLRFGDGAIDDPGECVSVAIEKLSDLVSRWAGQSRAYAGPDLLSALRGSLRRWIIKEREATSTIENGEYYYDRSEATSTLETRLEVMCHGEHSRLAQLTFARVFEGRTIAELADREGKGRLALKKELEMFALTQLL